MSAKCECGADQVMIRWSDGHRSPICIKTLTRYVVLYGPLTPDVGVCERVECER